MLTVTKTLENGILRAEFKGVFNETSDLQRLLGTGFTEIVIRCREISRINSLGVRTWCGYFHRLRCEAVKISFEELSPEIVCQMNFVSNLVERGEIRSVCLPFGCEACSHVTTQVMTMKELEQGAPDPQPLPCEKCGKPAEFTEIAAEYFSFLTS